MNLSQNVLEMSTMSPDKQRDGDATDLCPATTIKWSVQLVLSQF